MSFVNPFSTSVGSICSDQNIAIGHYISGYKQGFQEAAAGLKGRVGGDQEESRGPSHHRQ